MDLAQLAKDTVGHLVPALPYLVIAAEEGVKKIGESIGEGAVSVARKLWGKITGHTAASPALLEAANDLAAKPQDPDREAALRVQVGKLLESQPVLAGEIRDIIQTAVQQNRNAIASGTGVIANTGTMQGNTISISVKK